MTWAKLTYHAKTTAHVLVGFVALVALGVVGDWAWPTVAGASLGVGTVLAGAWPVITKVLIIAAGVVLGGLVLAALAS